MVQIDQKFLEQFHYRGILYTHKYKEDVTDPNIKILTIIYESLASFISGCVIFHH